MAKLIEKRVAKTTYTIELDEDELKFLHTVVGAMAPSTLRERGVEDANVKLVGMYDALGGLLSK